jgi:Fic family protein
MMELINLNEGYKGIVVCTPMEVLDNEDSEQEVRTVSNFYTESPLWHEKIGGIHALLERVKISEERFREQNGDVLRLRKLNRILSIHASTAIEGNRLTLGQVTDVINGVPVWGPPKDIKEVQNAWQAYNGLDDYDPWSVDDFLDAHELMTSKLIGESGAFRSVDVAVVRSDGVVMHHGANPASVPYLVAELFDWGRESPAHPLIKSSAVHFMLEHIHPFRDGNGRIGRLWQTLILSKWNPLFAWLPIETLVHYNQALYYKALQDSHSGEVDCRPFIDCMLDMIENSMYKFIDVATKTVYADDGGISGGISGGIKPAILDCVKKYPTLTAQKIADRLGVSKRMVERNIAELKTEGKLLRVGSNKNGHWEVLDA